MADGWNPERQAFVQSYGSDALDASNLLMPLVFFVAPNDPRMLSTLDAIRKPPEEGGLVSDGLVYRYDTARGASTACRATRGRSTCAPSGSSRR